VGGTSAFAGSSTTITPNGDFRSVLASGAGGDTFISAISGVSNGYQISVDTSNNQTYKWHNGAAERMRLDSSGNVGIGTASPSSPLHVSGSSNVETKIESTNDNAFLRISANSGGTGVGGNQDPLLIYQSGGSDVARIYHDNSASALIFDNNGTTERMRIDSSGNVGIGTTAPSTKLHVYGGATGSGVDVATFRSATGAFNIKCSDLSATNPTWTLRTFSAEPLAFGQGTTEVGRFDSSGNLHVGKTSSSNTTAGTSLLESGRFAFIVDQGSGGQEVGVINNQTSGTYVIDFRQANTDVGRIRVTASATEYQTSSDYRLKENVEYDWDATTRLNQLKPARFSWIANPDVGTVDGFLAHEVSDIVPESIGGEKDEVDSDGNPVYQGIDQSKLVPLLTKALQEAHAKIDDLTARIEALENA
jgi:hypothetical protein